MFSIFQSLNWADALRRKDFGSIADWFASRFFVMGGIGILAVGVAAGWQLKPSDGFRILSLSLIFGGACTISGWLLGLLFGVPRTLSRPTTPAPAAGSPGGAAAGSAAGSAPSSRVNTNLEDVSDWLTKTLVGVGLTQLLAAPAFLWAAAGKLDAMGFGWSPYGRLLALALFFYFTPGGFWLGYVGTRTILTKLFESIDGLSPENVEESAKAENLKLDPSANVVPASDGLAQADRALLSTPLQSLSTPKEMAAWGGAQARAGNLTAAQTALEEAHKTAPGDTDIRQQLATVYTARGMRAEADRLTPDDATTEVALYNALYEKDGYTKAIDIGERLIKRPGSDKNSTLHVWLACAYGQKYKALKSQNENDPALPDLKKLVLREIDAAIAASPGSRELLHSVWKPPAGEIDNDLTGFPPDDADLMARLEPTPAPAPVSAP
jgi:hypothetical protein